MNYFDRYRRSHSVFVYFLLCVMVALYSCGSSGGGGSSGDSGSTSNASLYITDNLTNDYEQVIVTVYKVELQKSSTGASLTAFEEPLGVTYDLRALSGILETLSVGSIPPGSYNRVLITVGEEIILVDNNDVQITPNPVFDSDDRWTACDAGKCVLEVTGAVNIIGRGNVILDFDLKRFTIETNETPYEVTAKIVLEADGSQHKKYHVAKQDNYKLKGIITTDAQNPAACPLNYPLFCITVLKAKHFTPPANIVTVHVDSATVYGCDDDDHVVSCPVSGFGDLAEGMKVEIRGSWDGTSEEFDAHRVAIDQDDDIAHAACTVPDRSITEFSNLIVQPMTEQKGGAVYTLDPDNHAVIIGAKTILITKETVIEYETGGSDLHICADEIPDTASEIEVRYYEGTDAQDATVSVAYKMEFKD